MQSQHKWLNFSLVLLLTLMTCLSSAVAVPATPASAALAEVGPINPDVGYASWYEDSSNPRLRLELCLEPAPSTLCLVNTPNSGVPSVPDNYPADGEAFWWNATATMDAGNGGRATMVLASEAAFFTPDITPGQQVAFNRIRVRVTNLTPGATYHVTHPYGGADYTADSGGQIFVTDDQGCIGPPCPFNTPLGGPISKWLTWDTFGTNSADAPPAGYIGDGATPHKVTGSLLTDVDGNPQNYFKVEGPDVGGAGVDVIQTDLFVVQGKLATLKAFASPAGGLFNNPQTVALSASENGATIFYTTDGSDPATSGTRSTYSSPIAINSTTTLKVVARNANGDVSPIREETYEINAAELSVSITPSPGVYSSPQTVTLTALRPDVAGGAGATIFYTTDGSDPSVVTNTARQQFTGQGSINLDHNGITTIKYYADLNGQLSIGGVKTAQYEIRAQQLTYGPLNPATGFPLWYKDQEGTKLGLCTDTIPQCLMPAPDPARAPAVPSNFPDESFWWAAEATMPTNNGGNALLVLALEAAFLNGDVIAGDQMNFYRVRLRIDNLVAGEKYTVTHPYGKVTFTASAGGNRGINNTVDDGCISSPCDFLIPATSPLGPEFLRWDPSASPAAPAGHLGDINVLHKVVGSPYGTNYLKIEGPNVGGSGVNVIQTDLFALQGQIYTPPVYVQPVGGVYIGGQSIVLSTPDPTGKIYYTLDGSTPTSSSTLYTGPIDLPNVVRTTTLKFFAVNDDGDRSPVKTEVYTINAVTPVVTANPPGGVYTTAQSVALSATDPAGAPPVNIYYTTNGSDPSDPSNGARTLYTGPINISNIGTTTLKYMAIDANDNQSSVGAQVYTIAIGQREVGPIDPDNGFPQWYKDTTGRSLDLCLDQLSGLCLAVAPDPNAAVTFPDNFPDESFYWNATAEILGATRATLVLATEAGFVPGAGVTAGQQITFNRIRVKITDLTPNANYTVTHPYGVETLTANSVGTIAFTDDVGCGAAPCDFASLFDSRISSWLVWDPSVAPAAPQGYVGDPAQPHKVIGSPTGNNFFRVVGPNAGGPGVGVIETDLFLVQGKLTGAPAPEASLSPTILSFGNQTVGTTSAAKTVTLTNSGNAALTISSIATSGDFGQTNTCPATLAAGASCTISVTFSPTAIGTRTGSLTIADDAAGSPHTAILSGTGTPPDAPAVSLNPASITFGNQIINTTSGAQPVTLTNSGTAALTISSIATSGDFGQTNTCPASPATLAAGASCTISVTFSPTATGTRTGSLTIADDASGSPHSVTLRGSGLPIPAPVVSLSPTSLTFASQTINTTSSAQAVTLTNTGNAVLTISSITTSGDFGQTNTCPASPATLAAGASCTISVTFTPTATGPRSGSLTIADDASGSPHTVALSGTGAPVEVPAVTLNPASLTFASQAVGTTSGAQGVTLTNSGTAALTISSIAISGDFAQTNTCPATLVAGASCTISVTFTPTATGARTGSLTIADDASGSPHSVTLSGTGTPAPAPAVSLSVTSLTFGGVTVGTTSAAQQVTLTNTGNAALTISSIATSGDFGQTNTCPASPATLAAGASCTISVTFTPTATGARTGSLTIADDASGSPHTIGLSGSGVAVNPPPATTTTFNPVADTYVDAASPARTFGTSNNLLAVASPPNSVKQIFIRFSVTGLAANASISSAKLRLFVTNGSTSGGIFNKITNNTWSEAATTWNNRPAIDGTQVGTLGAVLQNQAFELTLPAGAITGNGTYNFAIQLPSGNGDTVGYTAREGNAANRPQLIITTGGAVTPTPPAAPTGLTATPGDAQASLAWNAVAGATSYNVKRATSAAGPFNTIASPTGNNFVDGNLINGATVFYLVTAVNGAGESANSNVVSVTPAAAPPAGNTVTFTPVADTYVDASSPARTFGTSNNLLAVASPANNAKQLFVRFSVTGLAANANIGTVKLRLFVNNGSTSGGLINKITNNTWSEASTTWNNRPAIDGTQVASLGAVGQNQAVEVILPAGTITGNGTYNFAIQLPAGNGDTVGYTSREGKAANRPQLSITTN